MNKGECVVLVFSKAPVPGSVKTRLLPELNADDAARLYRELLERTLNTVAASAMCDTQLWCTPDTNDPFFVECRDKYHVQLRLQSGRDIGERMYAAIAANLSDYRSVLLVGCDCPELQQADLVTARDKLASCYDAVLGPASDGGYYLIGMKAAHRDVFADISWGMNTVLSDTRERLRTLGLACYELPVRWDLDDAESLRKYRNLVASCL